MPVPPRARFAVATVLALCCALLTTASPASAATFTVSVTTDSADGTCDAHCSLREAITAANAAGGGDTIVVPAGTYTLSLGPAGEDLNAGGDLDVVDVLTVAGAGRASTIVDGASLDRVFDVQPGADATFTGLTVRGGITTVEGGGIRTVSTLRLQNVDVSGNQAGAAGGGIAANVAAAVLHANDVSVRNNRAAAGGGGINVFNGEANLERVTLSGNTSEMVGGGLLNEAGTARLTNVTISGNAADEDGGGLRTIVGGSSFLNNVTVAGNTADADGGGASGEGGGIVAREASTIEVRNSIVAGNADLSGEAPDCFQDPPAVITSGGHNIIGNDTGCGFLPATGDQVGTGAAPIDPRLGPLADNGGPTQTHALLQGSPAIDKGNPAVPGSGGNACAATDQRGAPRNCDVGAYELVVCAKVTVNRVGTDSRDVLLGTSGADGFLTLGGKDKAKGLGGRDAACLGPGKDTGAGGGGKDLLKGEGGKDKLKGQGGKDRLKGGPGRDVCNGGPGRDKAPGCETRRAVP